MFASFTSRPGCIMATRQQRLNDFGQEGEPPAGELVELLCEDHIGTYVIPFPCRWHAGAWLSDRSGHPIEATVVGWRRQKQPDRAAR
jgi:hypothetical protein